MGRNDSSLKAPYARPVVDDNFAKAGALGFAISSAGPALAAVFSNPFDVAKTRMQLQNELTSYDRNKMRFSSTFDCLLQTFKKEGLKGLQRGLSISVMREGTKNLFRIGLFQPVLTKIHRREDGIAPMWKRMVAGAVSGSVSAMLCNPIEVIKTRMQSQGIQGITGVGYQHNYLGFGHAFSKIYKTEGVQVLWRGTTVSTIRSLISTSVNLAIYTGLKDNFIAAGWAGDDPLTDAGASAISAMAAVVIQHPVDLVRTRVYNQPYDVHGQGSMYGNPISATKKIFKTEGIIGFYKGLGPHIMRTVPHFMICFVIIGQMQRMAKSLAQTVADKKYNQQLLDAAAISNSTSTSSLASSLSSSSSSASLSLSPPSSSSSSSSTTTTTFVQSSQEQQLLHMPPPPAHLLHHRNRQTTEA